MAERTAHQQESGSNRNACRANSIRHGACRARPRSECSAPPWGRGDAIAPRAVPKLFWELEFAATKLHSESLLRRGCIDPEWVRIAMSSSIQPRAVVEIMLNCATFEEVTDKARGNVTVEEEDPDAWPE